MDGSGLTTGYGPSWNPLRCDGTTLPPGYLLAGKMLACWLFPPRLFLAAGSPFLPFFPILDSPFFASWLAPATAAAYYLAFLALMFNRAVRTSCLVIAGCLLVHIAGHRLAYANNAMFLCVFLLLIGLYDVRTGLWPLRTQLALVYGGASLNKALDPDWWNGRFFDTLMIDAFDVAWYQAMARALPEHWLGTLLGTIAIITEATICAAVLLSRNGRVGVVLMVLFHVGMLVATCGQLSIVFMYESLAVAAPFTYPVFSTLAASVPVRLAPALTIPSLWWLAGIAVRFYPTIRGWM